MHLSVILFSSWISQAFQASFEKAGSEPLLLAIFGLSLFVIASKVRRATSQLHVDQRMETEAPIVGRMDRIDRVPLVHLHAIKSTGTIEIAKDAVSS
jgi:hypothetical protein